MPKLKTHKGASKRFKKTGTGKVVRNHAFGRHILTSKPHKRKKKLHKSVVADKADQPVLKRMIPYYEIGVIERTERVARARTANDMKHLQGDETCPELNVVLTAGRLARRP